MNIIRFLICYFSKIIFRQPFQLSFSFMVLTFLFVIIFKTMNYLIGCFLSSRRSSKILSTITSFSYYLQIFSLIHLKFFLIRMIIIVVSAQHCPQSRVFQCKKVFKKPFILIQLGLRPHSLMIIYSFKHVENICISKHQQGRAESAIIVFILSIPRVKYMLVYKDA